MIITFMRKIYSNIYEDKRNNKKKVFFKIE